MSAAGRAVDAETGMAVLRKVILVLAVAPAALAVFGLQSHSAGLRKIAIALWVGGMAGATVASLLWLAGYAAK